jgi:hypothetical protein
MRAPLASSVASSGTSAGREVSNRVLRDFTLGSTGAASEAAVAATHSTEIVAVSTINENFCGRMSCIRS